MSPVDSHNRSWRRQSGQDIPIPGRHESPHLFVFSVLGPERMLHGTDNPVFCMRGRQREGRTYDNHTSHPFPFIKGWKLPEIESNYTLCSYETRRAIMNVTTDLGISKTDVATIFNGNARRLIHRIGA